ncbi:T9SS type A sorting domain-containing protein [Aequorivita marina]|uniref:T9SS type A sorting domain-containing protein n=1 Tax=Aequorivita marina TaxID=3073654 RepID=UPI00287447AD|nr:T9SS type A sorting domain-containing protein [Aequorivita sp. S2608]MDS1298708.1 T9SS type A sorting domain-containing protein [Aequorivita sp. S2608]
MKKLLLILLILPFLGFTQIQIGQDIFGVYENGEFGDKVALSSNGNVLAIAGYRYNNFTGLVSVFRNENNSWVQIGENLLGAEVFESFGESLALSSNGNVLAVGLTGIGKVNIYENIGENWVQIGNIIDIGGRAVSLSSDGTIIAIGSSLQDYVSVYKYINSNWVQVGDDIYGGIGGEHFGEAISLSSDGNILAIGAPADGANDGKLKIFENQSDTWVQIGETIVGGNALFGAQVSLSSDGNRVAVSRWNCCSNRGKVTIFEYDGGNWVQIGQDIFGQEPNESLGSHGLSLSPNGNILAVGARYHGIVRVYELIDEQWSLVTELNGNLNGPQDFFGNAISLSSEGNFISIGAPKYDSSTTDSGRVSVYDLSALLSVDKNGLNKLSLYPNPTKNTLNIVANDKINSIQVYNIIGQQILTTAPNTLTETIDMSEFKLGIYIIMIEIADQKATYKIVKE